jgi:hypothetical protein
LARDEPAYGRDPLLAISWYPRQALAPPDEPAYGCDPLLAISWYPRQALAPPVQNGQKDPLDENLDEARGMLPSWLALRTDGCCILAGMGLINHPSALACSPLHGPV